MKYESQYKNFMKINLEMSSAKCSQFWSVINAVIFLFTAWSNNMRLFTHHGPLARYVKLRVAHAPECPQRFPRHRLKRKPLLSDPGMHHGTCVTHMPWCMLGSLTLRWQGKRSRHSQRMRNRQFYITGKKPMTMRNDYVHLKYALLTQDE